LGREVSHPVKNVRYDYGKHIIRLPIDNNTFDPGIYYYSLQIGNKKETRKLIVN
jgi:signal peptidase I